MNFFVRLLMACETWVNVKRVHPYQRGRASITGFGL